MVLTFKTVTSIFLQKNNVRAKFHSNIIKKLMPITNLS